MEAHTGHLTADELLRMRDDGFHYELVRGELTRSPLAGALHGRAAMRVAVAMDSFVAGRGLGEVYAAGTGFQLSADPDTVRSPDAAFIGKERTGEVGEVQGYVPGAPDLAVEVVSPVDTYSEVADKVLDWLDAGTRMVLVVDPGKRVVTVYRSREEIRVLREGDVLDGGEVVPGWSEPVARLFP